MVMYSRANATKAATNVVAAVAEEKAANGGAAADGVDETGELSLNAGVVSVLNIAGDDALLPFANARRARGLSVVVTPCGVGSFFAGGGAEWRGRQARDDEVVAAGDPWLNGDYLWVEPPGTEWGANVHLIDLRDVENVGNSVQCNCGAYGQRTLGTPQDFDHSPLPGGGIMCCGDGALSPIAPSANASDGVPVSLLYNVTWFPNTTEAMAKVPDNIKAIIASVPLQSTIMVSSSPKMDGASCAGEYNTKPCEGGGGSEEMTTKWNQRMQTLGDQAPAPTNQTCDTDAVDGSGRPVTVAWSHPFRLPVDAAYNVMFMVGEAPHFFP